MSRKARPWYRSERNMWYAHVEGKQVPLHVEGKSAEAEAWAAFQRLLDQAGTNTQSVSDAVAAYLKASEPRVTAHTLKVYRWYLGRFVEAFGAVPLGSVTAEQLEADSRRPTWRQTTRANYLHTIEGCLRWAGVRLRIHKPPRASATADVIITEDTYRRMLANTSGDWQAIIRFLWETGCRPSEASGISVGMVDWEQRVVRIKQHKTSHHGKGDRLIYLNDGAIEVLGWQRQKYTDGLLFRSCQHKERLSRQAFAMKFCRLSKVIGRHVTSYGLRHSWATRALAAGESDTIVAALMGHAGTQMIHRHYFHASAVGRELANAANRIGRPVDMGPCSADSNRPNGAPRDVA